MHGYPRVVLYGASGDVLPFRYATGGDADVTSGKPATVMLAHGARCNAFRHRQRVRGQYFAYR